MIPRFVESVFSYPWRKQICGECVLSQSDYLNRSLQTLDEKGVGWAELQSHLRY